MASFLKRFGLGILYVVLLPFLLIILVVFMLWGIVNFFIRFFMGVIHFFKGKNFIPPLKEDVEAKKILEQRLEAKKQASENPTPTNIQPAPQITNSNDNVVNFNGTINIIQTDPNKPIDPNAIMNGIAQATTPSISQNSNTPQIENKPIEIDYSDINTSDNGGNDD